MFVFLNNKPFSLFHGNELAKWVGNIRSTIAILRNTFEDTEHISNMCQLLQLWNSLTKFLGMTKILMSKEMYMQNINTYTEKVTSMYDVGAKTVLTNNVSGDHETFYYHVLRFYIPKIAKETYDKYKLGVSIYNMQGFERRNKNLRTYLDDSVITKVILQFQI